MLTGGYAVYKNKIIVPDTAFINWVEINLPAALFHKYIDLGKPVLAEVVLTSVDNIVAEVNVMLNRGQIVGTAPALTGAAHATHNRQGIIYIIEIGEGDGENANARLLTAVIPAGD